MSHLIMRSDQKAAFTTSFLYLAMNSLDIDAERFFLEPNQMLTPDAIMRYTNDLELDMIYVGTRNDYFWYLRERVRILRDWALAGYSIEIKGE